MPPEERIATFDQDGTLWVEHPIYTQVVYCFDRIPAVVKAKPDLANDEPFKTVLSGNREAIAKLSMDDLLKIATATLTGMDVDAFRDEAAAWIDAARDPRWKRPYTDLTYLPQIELLKYLRGQRLQDLHRHRRRPGLRAGICGARLRHSPRAGGRQRRRPQLSIRQGRAARAHQGAEAHPQRQQRRQARKHPSDDRAQAHFAFGNSTGDRQMLEYTKAGDGARLAMLVLHDDAKREYAYGPAQGLPDTKVGTFTQELYDEAKRDGWIVVSMKNDWKRIFAFD